MEPQAQGGETESVAAPDELERALERVLERFAKTMIALSEAE